jgi:beta-galactosidase
VTINGTQVLTNFDIYATSGGVNKAVIEQFSTTANSSGQIVITSANVLDNAEFNGIQIKTSSGGGPIANGTYALALACATGSRLDDTGAVSNGTHMQIWTAGSGNANQAWTLTNIGGSTYTMTIDGTYCLDSGGTTTPGDPAIVWTCSGNTNEQWTATAVSGGYKFVVANSGLCLDDYAGGTGNGNLVDTYTCNGTNTQTWAPTTSPTP